MLLGALAATLRGLALVRDAMAHHRQPKISGVHPYVVEKLTAAAERFDRSAITRLFGELLETDVVLKRGGIPPSLQLVRLAVQEHPRR